MMLAGSYRHCFKYLTVYLKYSVSQDVGRISVVQPVLLDAVDLAQYRLLYKR